MTAVNDFNRSLIEEFRANDGKVAGSFEGTPLLLLTTVGAKSGEPRTAPIVYLPDGDRVVVFASKGGAPKNPDWYHNLRANPTVTIELPGERYEARAVVTEGDEREQLWERQKTAMPNFADYEGKTTRQIPVVALERIS